MRDSRNKGERNGAFGFTLIEMLIVLAIITIIASASVPQVQMWSARNRGKAAVSNIIADFAKAKSIASYAMEANSAAANDDDTRLKKNSTAILFRKTSYILMQKETTNTADWNENVSGFDVLRTVRLPHNASIERVNTGSTNDGAGTSVALEFTSSGRVRQSSGLLVPSGAGAGNLVCGTSNSPLNGRRVFVAVLKVDVGDAYAFYYQVEIDSSGEYFVCVQPGDKNTIPSDFNASNANILDI